MANIYCILSEVAFGNYHYCLTTQALVRYKKTNPLDYVVQQNNNANRKFHHNLAVCYRGSPQMHLAPPADPSTSSRRKSRASQQRFTVVTGKNHNARLLIFTPIVSTSAFLSAWLPAVAARSTFVSDFYSRQCTRVKQFAPSPSRPSPFFRVGARRRLPFVCPYPCFHTQ